MPDSPPTTPVDEKTCRICLDGPDITLGRLIHPCLCKGSISHVHVKCLQRWRLSSSKAFFECPQCKYKYNLNRTSASGLAHNRVILGAATAVLFMALVMASSFVTTLFFRPFDHRSSYSSSSWVVWHDWSFISDFVDSFLGIIRDQEDRLFSSAAYDDHRPLGLVRRFVVRFIQGLPLVSGLSLLMTPLATPLQLLARWRGYRRNRDTADFATIIMVGLLLFGAAKTLITVYEMTERQAQRFLLKAEDAVLEVS